LVPVNRGLPVGIDLGGAQAVVLSEESVIKPPRTACSRGVLQLTRKITTYNVSARLVLTTRGSNSSEAAPAPAWPIQELGDPWKIWTDRFAIL
jgi:hypothetical protein